MYELTIYETVHHERVNRVESFANERNAVKMLRPARRAGLGQVRTLLATLLPRSEQPRRRAPLASS